MPKEIKSYKCLECGDLIQTDSRHVIVKKLHIVSGGEVGMTMLDVCDEAYCDGICLGNHIKESTQQN